METTHCAKWIDETVPITETEPINDTKNVTLSQLWSSNYDGFCAVAKLFVRQCVKILGINDTVAHFESFADVFQGSGPFAIPSFVKLVKSLLYFSQLPESTLEYNTCLTSTLDLPIMLIGDENEKTLRQRILKMAILYDCMLRELLLKRVATSATDEISFLVFRMLEKFRVLYSATEKTPVWDFDLFPKSIKFLLTRFDIHKYPNTSKYIVSKLVHRTKLGLWTPMSIVLPKRFEQKHCCVAFKSYLIERDCKIEYKSYDYQPLPLGSQVDLTAVADGDFVLLYILTNKYEMWKNLDDLKSFFNKYPLQADWSWLKDKMDFRTLLWAFFTSDASPAITKTYVKSTGNLLYKLCRRD